ncbi:Cna B-type domain-containing protein [Lactococcus ileimucosae]|uniref:Cna B-type domain-containing protein n=1 Tax=Lactococcus ileimucosae TaxID=2941329 RepID=UPI00204322B0|nr:Cna B-type domain-containing protein [Lactococcus ileimucosae]
MKKNIHLFGLVILLFTYLALPVIGSAQMQEVINSSSVQLTNKIPSTNDYLKKQNASVLAKNSGEGRLSSQALAVSQENPLNFNALQPRDLTKLKEVIPVNGIDKNAAADDKGNPIDASDWIAGDSYDVKYNWNIPNGVSIHEGDTSTVELPEGAIFAKNENFNIIDANGNVVGRLIAKAGDTLGTIIWSDYYETRPNNRLGTLHFVLTGIKPAPAASDLSKNGWPITQLPNGHYSQIQWQLRINVDNKKLENVSVNDQLQNANAQTIDTNSFSLMYTDGSGPVPAADYTLSLTETGFTITFNTQISKAIDVMYTSTLTKGIPYLVDGTRMVFPNEVSMKAPNIDAKASKDVVLGERGEGAGDSRGVILSKIDAMTGERIPHVHFKLTNSFGDTIMGYEDLVTDENGQIHLSNLPLGAYSFVETHAKEGYVIDTTPINFSITEGQENAVQLIAKNDEATSVTVTKYWEDNNNQDGLRPDSIQVQLYANGEKLGEAVTLSKDSKWTYTWKSLSQKYEGKDILYTVKEITKVNGYETIINDSNKKNIIITNKHHTTKTDRKKSHNNDKNNKKTSSSPQHALPKTGEDDRMALISTGIAFVFLAITFIFSNLRLKRYKK